MEQVRDASAEFFALSPPRRAAPAWRGFVLAALVSLALHGGMAGLALWLLGRLPAPRPLRELSVRLAPRPSAPAVGTSTEDPAASASSRAAQAVAAAPQRPAPSTPREIHASQAPSPPPAAPSVAALAGEAPAAALPQYAAPPPARDEAAESRVAAIEAHVLDWLARYRSYPRAARRAGIEGVVTVSTVLARDGSLGERRIAASSGHDVLDRAALDLLARASPLPPLPDLPREVELRLPIVYRLNR